MMPRMQALLLLALGLLFSGPKALAKVLMKQSFWISSCSWENCDEGKDPVLIKRLSVAPNPTVGPGNVTVSVETQMHVTPFCSEGGINCAEGNGWLVGQIPMCGTNQQLYL